MDWETANPVYGATVNPVDPARSPGGSSGGEAAAIAAGLSAGGIGSDGGGSIRLPAAFCEICGLKPTPGRIPAAGHFPKIVHPGGLLGVIGPMARTVADVAVLFRALEGPDDSDPFSALGNLAAPLSPLIGVVEHPTTNAALRWLPYPTEPIPAFPWERAFDVWCFFFLRLNAHAIGEPTPHTAVYLDMPPPTAAEILEMFALRDALRARLLDLMRVYPYLLLPVALAAPWGPGAFPGPDAIQPLTIANIFGLPALALPPFLQIVARPWHEHSLLALGEEIERRRGPIVRRYP
jgi:Asp-tRNA(Asn)/Glu-tRNA(Gln) amidotransferase A subunit family amidase